MVDPRWLMRARLWVRRPPSMRMVKLVFGAIALAALVLGIDYLGLWPDWAESDRFPRRIKFQPLDN